MTDFFEHLWYASILKERKSMEIDELINAMYMIARQSHHEEIKESLYVLAHDIGKNGVSRVDPNTSDDCYPFNRLINDLEVLAERARYSVSI